MTRYFTVTLTSNPTTLSSARVNTTFLTISLSCFTFLVHLLLMLQTLLLQGFGDGSNVLQSFQQLNARLSILQQEHTLPVGLLLLHQHLQGDDEEEDENRKR